ncbi:FecR family protein [Mucilaginibacter aquariorum]|uniref:FecR domain-containing protein n=1 Tax=Mucilaginibacter aquariorum TaxID=2967225 RepID=A0ABT1SY93_9SPHI|nr:FecR domain-containing protein [Mucilaginibacter aquariorum]MCQ6957317.1 FecR domain-containing protein [Mucilaginibacter aquariorum]
MDQEIILLLKKYVANSCHRQELEQARQVLASGNYEEEWKAVLEQEAIDDMADDSAVTDFDAERVFSRVQSTIKPVRKINISRWSLGIAASLLLVLSAGYLFWKSTLAPVNDGPLLSLVTTAGQQKKITLSDGTDVTLNCGSTLQYTAAFTGAKREVYLNGEAFFNVKHDTKRPFLVHTGRLHVQVLGTSFNVNAYRTDKQAAVSVASGKVGVNNTKVPRTYMLLPGDRLSYNNDNTVIKSKMKIEDMLAWQKRTLVFQLETIREIAPKLERYYGVRIFIKPKSVPFKQVTASFTRRTLPQVLNILSQTAGFSYTINKNEVHIN